MITEMSFPTRIVLGREAVKEVPNHLARLGIQRPLLVSDPGVRDAGLVARLTGVLQAAGIPWSSFDQVEPGPTSANIEAGVEAYFAQDCDGLLALGGGSVMDAAKGIRLLVTHPGPIWQYAEPQEGWRSVIRPLPAMVAVPTAAGAGSEVDRALVVRSAETGRAATISAPSLLPSVAICDPELTFSLPPLLTASCGMDAFTRSLEALLAKGFHPLADALARTGIELCTRHLARVVRNWQDGEARTHMMVAALAGACAAEKGCGAAHSLAHALAASAGLQHGLASAIVLPAVMEFALAAATPALAQVALAMGEPASDDATALAHRAIERVRALLREVALPGRLRDLGLLAERIPELAERAYQDEGHQSSPRPCSPADLEAILRAVF